MTFWNTPLKKDKPSCKIKILSLCRKVRCPDRQGNDWALNPAGFGGFCFDLVMRRPITAANKGPEEETAYELEDKKGIWYLD